MAGSSTKWKQTGRASKTSSSLTVVDCLMSSSAYRSTQKERHVCNDFGRSFASEYTRLNVSTAAGDKKAQLTQGLRATVPSFQDDGCSKMAVSRHLGYYRTENSAIRSADLQNPSLEQNMQWIGCTICEIFAFKLHCDLETGVRGHSRSSKTAPFDRTHTTLYLSMPLSLTFFEI